jgi:hypothetical protein
MISVIAVALAMLILSGGAWAARRTSLSIRGPRRVRAGQRVQLRFTGYAGSGVSRLRVWLDDRSCATTAQAESAREGLEHRGFHVVRTFRDRLTVEHSSKGTHVVCAYLVHRASQRTAARASWRYVTS